MSAKHKVINICKAVRADNEPSGLSLLGTMFGRMNKDGTSLCFDSVWLSLPQDVRSISQQPHCSCNLHDGKSLPTTSLY